MSATLLESGQKPVWTRHGPRGRSGGRPEGLSERYRKIAPEVKEIYEKNSWSTDEIREMFKIKSQPTLYKILKHSGVDIKGFLKKPLPYNLSI